jgi:hypothetical protein
MEVKMARSNLPSFLESYSTHLSRLGFRNFEVNFQVLRIFDPLT